ncbi:hypothetical protein QTP70_025377 [Hemibagrus guttatus]|uniref:ribonuclease H n=1 Tax=Hemibagrus guttatus TaxID=175788 RepID=A0AAE0R1U9_9TELE|nr:hypothetical protein QTP70_025377 [Hemibagrus guttatus]
MNSSSAVTVPVDVCVVSVGPVQGVPVDVCVVSVGPVQGVPVDVCGQCWPSTGGWRGEKMSIQEPDQNCVSLGDRGGFFIPSDTERDWAGEEHGDRVGIQQKRLRGALDGLFRAVRCESESVRPEHISTLVEIIVRNFRKKETSVSWAHGDQDGGKDREVTGELDCPRCNLFIAEPVTVACGHSYCRSCLEQAFLSKCKKCQEELGEKHLLRANVVLSGILEKWFPEEIHKTKKIAEVKGLLRSKHFTRALSLATQLLDSDPSNIRLRVCRAEAYRCLQHYHHALEDLDICVTVAPSVEVVFCKAKLLKEMGCVDESVKLCLQCLCVDQDFQEARQEVENILCDLLVPTCESVQTLEECSEPSGLIRAQSLRAHMVGGVRGEGLKRVSSAPQLGEKGALLKRKLSGLEVGPEVVETSDNKHKKHGVSSAASACSDEDNLHLSVPRDLLDPSDFECSLCMRLFYEPVTTPCGHSFCKNCLQRSLDHSPQCPLCKESLRLYLASRRFSITRVLDDIIKRYLCEEHAGRQKIHNDETKELSDLENNVPIFVCTMAYPTVPCPLHVFEPRYRLMIRRCIETGTRQFGMCISDTNKGFADFGCMLHIRNVHFLPDGRSVVDTFGGKRFHVITRSMRDGYYIANIEYLQDQRVEGKEERQLQDLYDQVYNQASVWFHSLENRFRNQILQHFGPMPEKEMDIQKLRQALGGQVVLPDDWETTAEVIRETGRKVLGVSSGRRKEDKETWWWNEEVQDSVQRKRLAKKKWDMDRTEENRQEYKELQRRVKREVSKAKQKAYDELYTRLDTREGEKDLYRLARQRDRDGKDVQQVRVIKDRDGRVLTSEESVQRRWKEYFEELMNEENEREKRVEGVNSVEQKVDKIRKDEVRKALKRMKSGKAVGPDDIPVETWRKYDRVPREELWYCMRKSGVAEKYVRVVQDMYERSRTVVRCAVGQTEEFKVEVGLHQGSALSPFLFAMVMDQLSEEVRQESPWTMMFADDIVICSESREQVEENLERWRFALERRGMKVSGSKTEYMCVNKREGSGTVRLQGEEVKKVQEFKYLGSTVQSNGECGKEVKKRVQAGWNGWRKVCGVLCERKISVRIKGKVYRTVVRAAMLYGLETVSLRKRQESELESSPNGPACCWWLLAVLPVDPRYQLSVLSMTTLRERLVKIQHILAYLQNAQHEKSTHVQARHVLVIGSAEQSLIFTPQQWTQTQLDTETHRNKHLHTTKCLTQTPDLIEQRGLEKVRVSHPEAASTLWPHETGCHHAPGGTHCTSVKSDPGSEGFILVPNSS